MASRVEAGRLALTGTLAADTLDLSGFLAPFAQAIAPNGGWSWEPLSLSGAAAADLDLRLSATTARVGAAKLSDVALNVLIKPGRLEAALGRAGLADGSVKGRLLLVSTPDGVDLKAHGNAQGLDIAALTTSLSSSNWIAGTASGQFTLEAAGPTAAEMAQRANGRATIAVKQGEFVGLALDDALKRFERQPLSASLNLRSGRTPFREAQATLSLTDGIGEISDGSFTAAALKGRVRGRIVAPERSLVAKAAVESLAPVTEGKLSPALAFEISGTWGDLSILPDAKALIERSGAARLLLSPRPLPPPIAPVQIESAIQ
jgi:AsmA protein